jgi:hypothetical protein
MSILSNEDALYIAKLPHVNSQDLTTEILKSIIFDGNHDIPFNCIAIFNIDPEKFIGDNLVVCRVYYQISSADSKIVKVDLGPTNIKFMVATEDHYKEVLIILPKPINGIN